MKSIFIIIAVLAAAVTFAIWQNTKLHQLKQQTASLESRVSHPSSVRPTRSIESALPSQSASQAEQDALFEEIVTAFLAFKEHDQDTSRTRLRDMLLTAAKFSAADIEQFLQKLRVDHRLAGSLDENETIQLCLQFFAEASPFAAMMFLEGHREMPDWKNHYLTCFYSYLRANPSEAIRWFDEQIALGNTDIAHSSVRQTRSTHRSRQDARAGHDS